MNAFLSAILLHIYKWSFVFCIKNAEYKLNNKSFAMQKKNQWNSGSGRGKDVAISIRLAGEKIMMELTARKICICCNASCRSELDSLALQWNYPQLGLMKPMPSQQIGSTFYGAQNI